MKCEATFIWGKRQDSTWRKGLVKERNLCVRSTLSSFDGNPTLSITPHGSLSCIHMEQINH